jgi:hypothetical protein
VTLSPATSSQPAQAEGRRGGGAKRRFTHARTHDEVRWTGGQSLQTDRQHQGSTPRPNTSQPYRTAPHLPLLSTGHVLQGCHAMPSHSWPLLATLGPRRPRPAQRSAPATLHRQMLRLYGTGVKALLCQCAGCRVPSTGFRLLGARLSRDRGQAWQREHCGTEGKEVSDHGATTTWPWESVWYSRGAAIVDTRRSEVRLLDSAKVVPFSSAAAAAAQAALDFGSAH